MEQERSDQAKEEVDCLLHASIDKAQVILTQAEVIEMDVPSETEAARELEELKKTTIEYAELLSEARRILYPKRAQF